MDQTALSLNSRMTKYSHGYGRQARTNAGCGAGPAGRLGVGPRATAR